MFWLIPSTKTWKQYPPKKLEPSTFHPLRHVKITLPQEVFPSPNPSSEATAHVVLRIQGRLGLEEPLHDLLGALPCCQMQRCLTSGSRGPMAQARQAEPNGTKGEKNPERILAPQKWKFWKLWSLKILTKIKHCCFEMSWGQWIALNKHAVAFGILLKPSQRCW